MRFPFFPETDVSSVPKDIERVHLVRPVAAAKLENLLNRRNIRDIDLSKSCLHRLSRSAKQLLKERGIKLVLQERRGRAIDLDIKQIKRIIDLYRDDKTFREIGAETGVPKSTVHYLVKYADRTKIRVGGRLLYLE